MGRRRNTLVAMNEIYLHQQLTTNVHQLSSSTVFFGENIAQLLHLILRQTKSFQIPRKNEFWEERICIRSKNLI